MLRFELKWTSHRSWIKERDSLCYWWCWFLYWNSILASTGGYVTDNAGLPVDKIHVGLSCLSGCLSELWICLFLPAAEPTTWKYVFLCHTIISLVCKLLSEITFPESEKAECIKTPDLKTGMDLMARSQSVLMVNYANIFIPLYTLISPLNSNISVLKFFICPGKTFDSYFTRFHKASVEA